MTSHDAESILDDWDGRVLCSDESCIGVLGRDGHCTTCGKKGAAAAAANAEHLAVDVASPRAVPAAIEAEAAHSEDDGDFAQRELCSDENCLGLIGPNRTCKVCGAFQE